MAVANVQNTSIESSGAVSSLAKAFTSNITAGNAILVGVLSDGGKATGSGIFTGTSCSFTRITQLGGDVSVGRSLNHGGGAVTVTYTPDSGTDYSGMGIQEVSGLDPSPDDGSITNSGTASIQDTGAIVMTAAGIIFGGFDRHGAGAVGGSTIDGGHVAIFTRTGYVSVNGSIAYYLVASGSRKIQWDDNSVTTAWKACAMALKQVGSGQSVVPIIMALNRQRGL